MTLSIATHAGAPLQFSLPSPTLTPSLAQTQSLVLTLSIATHRGSHPTPAFNLSTVTYVRHRGIDPITDSNPITGAHPLYCHSTTPAFNLSTVTHVRHRGTQALWRRRQRAAGSRLPGAFSLSRGSFSHFSSFSFISVFLGFSLAFLLRRASPLKTLLAFQILPELLPDLIELPSIPPR